jgi:hypothetical protein
MKPKPRPSADDPWQHEPSPACGAQPRLASNAVMINKSIKKFSIYNKSPI